MSDAADALYRAAVECCHQHDRVARIVRSSSLEVELAAAQRICEACSGALRELAETYEETSAAVHPEGADTAWWRRANALWLASKEYVRRHNGCDDATRQFREHGPERLGELHTEYELEASALLALKQAAEAYRRDRPAVS